MIRPPKYCKKKPRYADGIIVHPYCGRTCANIAKSKGPANVNRPLPASPVSTFIVTNPSSTATPRNTAKRSVPVPANPRNSVIYTNSTNTQKNRSSVYWKTSSAQTCKTPGCSSPVYVDRHGVASDYCTRTHRQYVSQFYLVS